MKKDIEWLKEEAMNLYPSHSEVYEYPDYLTIEKVDLINNFIDLIYQLDEPEVPAIPQFVADWIEDYRDHGGNTVDILGSLTAVFNSSPIIDKKVIQWFKKNTDKMLNSLVHGYEVEKEKLYRVRAGNRYVRFNLDGSIIGAKKDNSIVCLERLSKLPFDYKKAVESGIITLEEVTE